MNEEKQPKRVFILGGGAALGAHQIGALRYLEEQGVRPDAIIGSSIGIIRWARLARQGLLPPSVQPKRRASVTALRRA